MPTDTSRRDRVLAFLIPALRVLSFQVGQKCELDDSHQLNAAASKPMEQASRTKLRGGRYAAMTMMYQELFRLGTLVKEDLYSCDASTTELIRSGGHYDAVRHHVAAFNAWNNTLEQTEGETSYLSTALGIEAGPSSMSNSWCGLIMMLTCDPGPAIFRHYLRLRYYSMRIFIHTIGLQSLAYRLRASQTGNPGLVCANEMTRALLSDRGHRDMDMVQEVSV